MTTSIRRPLQDQLLKAWDKAIKKDYRNQRINSERSLQASFWAQLNKTLNPATRRMFIEPRLRLKTKKGVGIFVPDIVVCSVRKVIAVIEIKYLPRARPVYDADVTKLRRMSRRRTDLHVSNRRFLGPVTDAREYHFSANTLFVWAGVHRAPKKSFVSTDVPMLSDGIKELDGCFIQLHAETRESDHPSVFIRRS